MRNLPSQIASAYSQSNVSPILMGELFFDSGTLRMWTGLGTLQWGDLEFIGGGNFIGISPIEETQDLSAKGVVLSLNGVAPTNIALALSERPRGRPFRLYLGTAESASYVINEEADGFIELEDGSGYIALENRLSGDPYRIFSGLMDVIESTDNGQTAVLRLSVENILIIGQRNKISRYTEQEQKKLYPGDLGLDMINQLQDREIIW